MRGIVRFLLRIGIGIGIGGAEPRAAADTTEWMVCDRTGETLIGRSSAVRDRLHQWVVIDPTGQAVQRGETIDPLVLLRLPSGVSGTFQISRSLDGVTKGIPVVMPTLVFLPLVLR